MAKTIKAKKATIVVGNFSLDVAQMPNGEYRYSDTNAAEAIDEPDNSFLRFRRSKAFKALLEAGSPSYITEKVAVEGLSKPINASNADSVFAYWLHHSPSNPKAYALIIACGAETLDRRADAAFEVKRSEEEYNARLQARLDGILARRSSTDAIAAYVVRHQSELSDNQKHWIYNNFTDHLYKVCFGCNARKLRQERGLSADANLREFFGSKELLVAEKVEDLAARLIDRDIAPMDAVDQAMERLLIV